MHWTTRQRIVNYLNQARYELAGVADRSPDEVATLDELFELTNHVKSLKVEGE